MAELVTVTDNSFDPEVLKCDIPVIADFWAEWSAPSRTIESHLREIAADYEERLKLVKVDIESNPNVASNYNVLKIPTLIILKHGMEVERLTGPQDKDAILSAVTPYLDE